jgi:hypothetical protein
LPEVSITLATSSGTFVKNEEKDLKTDLTSTSQSFSFDNIFCKPEKITAALFTSLFGNNLLYDIVYLLRG